MQNIQNILNDKDFEYLLNSKKKIALFESSVLDGHLDFIKKCTVKLTEHPGKYPDNDLVTFLYILKYIFNCWGLSDKKIRANKKLGIRVLFLIFFVEEFTDDWSLILQQSVELIEQSWAISQKNFPFLFQEEIEKISSQVSVIASEKKLLKNLSAIKFDDHLNSSSYPFLLPETARNLNELYFRFYQIPEQFKNNAEGFYLKAIFSGILESKLTLDFPGVLSCLPLGYLCGEVEKALNSIIPPATIQKNSALSSFKISGFCYPKRKLFVKDGEGGPPAAPFLGRMVL